GGRCICSYEIDGWCELEHQVVHVWRSAIRYRVRSEYRPSCGRWLRLEREPILMLVVRRWRFDMALVKLKRHRCSLGSDSRGCRVRRYGRVWNSLAVC